jgi:hypothetical protein
VVSGQILVMWVVMCVVSEINTTISGEILLPFQGHLNPEDVDVCNFH